MSALAQLTLLFLQYLRFLRPRPAAAAIARWHGIVRSVLDQRGQDALLVLWSYLFHVTDLKPERIKSVLARLIDPETEESLMSTAERLLKQGRAEGHAEGRTEGQATLLLRQLTARFGPLTEATTTRVRAANPTDLERWAVAVLSAGTLDEVFATR